VSVELKPCPFCGSKDVELFGFLNLYVYCFSCKCEGPSNENKNKAIAKWNKRTAKCKESKVKRQGGKMNKKEQRYCSGYAVACSYQKATYKIRFRGYGKKEFFYYCDVCAFRAKNDEDVVEFKKLRKQKF
jgi:Lar family restriction alleviation protein